MTLIRPRIRMALRAAVLGVVAVAILATTALNTSTVEAQTIPFKAWGSGRASGDVIKAFKGTAEVGTVTVGSTGQWEINIFLGGSANVANSDMINFTVNGAAAKETVSFASGQFAPVPGLVFTLTSPAGPSGPTGPTAPPAAANTGSGTIAGTVTFDSTGKALAVYNGGTVSQLVTASTQAKATGIWVQGPTGQFFGYVLGAPDFVNASFNAAFPNGFGVVSILLVK